MAEVLHAWVLHTRSFREHSLVVEVFSRERGRVGVFLRAGRRAGKTGAMPEPLQPLLITLAHTRSKTQLATANKFEADGPFIDCPRMRLRYVMYANNLLLRELQPDEPHLSLFSAYERALCNMAAASDYNQCESVLCGFEMLLMKELGYFPDMRCDARSGQAIDARGWYRFEQECGFVRIADRASDPQARYRGSDILAAGELISCEPRFFSLPVKAVARCLKHSYLSQERHGGGAPESEAFCGWL